jgi:hypothetical protein
VDENANSRLEECLASIFSRPRARFRVGVMVKVKDGVKARARV